MHNEKELSVKSFNHFDETGHAHIVNISDKPNTLRRAEAVARVITTSDVIQRLRENSLPKGDVLAVARVAGIMAAKKTSELIPLCHPIALSHVAIHLHTTQNSIEIQVIAECMGSTGVEMEAMTGASVTALTVYDMIKGVDRNAHVFEVKLRSKSGGRSGNWVRNDDER